MKFNILIVDDEKGFADSLSEALSAPNRNIKIALCAKDAVKIISSQSVHLVLLDEKLPDMSGIDLLESISKNYKDIISIVITATKSIPLVVRSIQLGAYQYIVKPFKIEELENIVKNALEKVELKTKVKSLEEGTSNIDKPVFIGASPKIEAIREQIDKLKGHPFSSILITGETGTGKGNLAKYIHWQFFKDMESFVHISCADIPANLLETELFGYAKGAFTDAKDNKQGLFELANKGTLFLDEIDAFPLDLQKKLLNFLDNKKIRKVGGTKEIDTDVRLIAATNANLANLVKEQKFRKDLYFRLNMLYIEIPPLRERVGDLEDLANYFRELFNLTFSKNITKISGDALSYLKNHLWPGNIRELKNTIERAMIFASSSTLSEKELEIMDNEEEGDVKINFPLNKDSLIPLKDLELKYIKHVLDVMGENRTHTANLLDISVPTLLSKIKNDI